MVSRELTQQCDIDYQDTFDTFSLVVKLATVHLVLALVVSNSWLLRQIDVRNALFHGFLNKDVYMKQPPGFEDSQNPD